MLHGLTRGLGEDRGRVQVRFDGAGHAQVGAAQRREGVKERGGSLAQGDGERLQRHPEAQRVIERLDLVHSFRQRRDPPGGELPRVHG